MYSASARYIWGCCSLFIPWQVFCQRPSSAVCPTVPAGVRSYSAASWHLRSAFSYSVCLSITWRSYTSAELSAVPTHVHCILQRRVWLQISQHAKNVLNIWVLSACASVLALFSARASAGCLLVLVSVLPTTLPL